MRLIPGAAVANAFLASCAVFAQAQPAGSADSTYVGNIYKYYTAYKLLLAQDEDRRKARETVKKPS